MKTIGILGGMGPRVTALFEQMLLDRLSGNDQQLPTIITINDGSIPDRSQFLLGRGPDPRPRLQRNLTLLEQMGAEIICVPCNSASVPQILGNLQVQNSGTKVLNLPQLVVAELQNREVERVCLLATEGTTHSQTYQQLCAAADIDCVVPSAAVRSQVSDVITAVKYGVLPVARSRARVAARALCLLNCQAIILGCTELPLVAEQLVPPNMQPLDTLAVLADACVVECNKGENRAARPIHA